MHTIRIRAAVWFSTGVAMTLLASLLVVNAWRADAVTGDAGCTTFPAMGGTTRILESRDPAIPFPVVGNVGLAGPFFSGISQKLKVTGPIPTGDGTTKTVVPVGASLIGVNVTFVNNTTQGFVALRSGDATGVAATSSENVTTSNQVLNNFAIVPINAAGFIDIQFNGVGAPANTDLIIDAALYCDGSALKAMQTDIDALKKDVADLKTSGVAGPKGDKGDPGPAGPKGDKGDTGPQGPPGASASTASLLIVKDADPNDPQDFAFTTDLPGAASFSLDDDSDPTLSNQKAITNITPGTYSVSETLPAGWAQTSATCSDGSPVTAIVLAAAESVTCTFENMKVPTVADQTWKIEYAGGIPGKADNSNNEWNRVRFAINAGVVAGTAGGNGKNNGNDSCATGTVGKNPNTLIVTIASSFPSGCSGAPNSQKSTWSLTNMTYDPATGIIKGSYERTDVANTNNNYAMGTFQMIDSNKNFPSPLPGPTVPPYPSQVNGPACTAGDDFALDTYVLDLIGTIPGKAPVEDKVDVRFQVVDGTITNAQSIKHDGVDPPYTFPAGKVICDNRTMTVTLHNNSTPAPPNPQQGTLTLQNVASDGAGGFVGEYKHDQGTPNDQGTFTMKPK